jgi:hypothetical protein
MSKMRAAAVVTVLLMIPCSLRAVDLSQVAPGTPMRVTTTSSGRVAGLLEEATADGLRLRVDAEGGASHVVSVRWADARKVQARRGRHVRRGLIIGAITGIIVGSLAFGACEEFGCEEGESGKRLLGYTVAFTAAGAGIGALFPRWQKVKR